MAKKRLRKSSKRSAAAKKGWSTRRKNFRKRSLASKKGWATRKKNELKKKTKKKKEREPEYQEFIVTIDYKHKRKGLFADLYVIAKAGSDATMIADLVRHKLMHTSKTFLANFIEGGFTEIVQGKKTNSPPMVKIRQFKRIKEQ